MALAPTSLPIDEVLPTLCKQLEKHHEVVLIAPPGAGKTTRVPLAILQAPWLGQQKILLIEPRRIATLATAHFLSKSLQQPCGHTVGYRMRLDTKISSHTRIEVITHGVLLRMLQQDPSLEGIGAVIFDEFHERSLDGDLSLAMCLQGRELLRDEEPLKLVIMSATMDAKSVSQLLDNAPIVVSQGRQFPVTTHQVCPAPSQRQLYNTLYDTVAQALANHQGSLLIFLPGRGEIHRAQDQLASLCTSQIELFTLYGELPMEQQQLAISPAAKGKRKIVLATNIAETSLTIEGIECVIDLGLSRQMAYDTRTGLSRLRTVKVSRAQATQRAGRAGRLSAGTCYRLWSDTEQQGLAPHASVEIKQTDLTNLCLQLYAFGCSDPDEMRWMDPPPQGPWQKAEQLLTKLGGLMSSAQGLVITPHGQRMSQLPLSPRLGHLLITAQRYNALPLGCQLVALLSEKDPLATRSENDYDLMLRVNWLNSNTPIQPNLMGLRQRVAKQATRLFSQMPHDFAPPINHTYDQSEVAAILVAHAWPERIAQQTSDTKQYKLANGKRVTCQQSNSGSPWLAVASTIGFEGKTGDNAQRLCLAVTLPYHLFSGPLKHLTQEQTNIFWHEQHDRLIAEQHTQVGQLQINTQRITKIDPQVRIDTTCRYIAQLKLSPLNWDKDTLNLQAKVQLLHQSHPSSAGTPNPWPNVSSQRLIETLSDWLGPFLATATHVQDLKRLNLKQILSNLLPWPLPNQLEQLAPARFTVPSGNAHTIDYSQNPPVLAVKLQELFGMQEPPSVGYGTALQVHLLSPRGQVLQVTQDLANFWATSYIEVKKEMKGRYPRHPWPDDPTQALATAKTNRALRKP